MNTIASKKISILIAEDDYFNRLLVISMLAKNKDINVLEAKDGEEALEMLAKHQIDILLLDLYMPNMNGFETLLEIQSIEKIKNLPIIIISSDETEKKKSLALGAKAFMTKPFNLKILTREIYSLLEEVH